MAFFRKHWTPHEADEWTKEDWWAIGMSSLSYALGTISIALLFLRPLWGIVSALGAVVAIAVMWRAIDPKLRSISEAYEHRQKDYLKELDRVMKWEEH